MNLFPLCRPFLVSLLFFALGLLSPSVNAADAGGISLGATRVIYLQGKSQVSLPINNSDAKAVFLIQSWIENSQEIKSSDFVVTPPLFVMKPQKENTLRIMYVGQANLPTDRESLYWVNVKAIPSADKEVKDKNTLQIAVLSRIKLFFRPPNLSVASVEAPTMLRFHKSGQTLTVKNPTPYYVTLVKFYAGNTVLPTTMVPPRGQVDVTLPINANGTITYQTVNDYGANTPALKAIME